jgi:hypothetical protein
MLTVNLPQLKREISRVIESDMKDKRNGSDERMLTVNPPQLNQDFYSVIKREKLK